MAFLLGDGVVIHCTPAAESLLPTGLRPETDWAALYRILEPRFPTLPAAMPQQAGTFAAADDPDVQLRCVPVGGMIRMVLEAPPLTPGDRHRLAVDQCLLSHLRAAADIMPSPAWRSTADGRTVWRNAAYDAVCFGLGQDPETECPFDLTRTDKGAADATRVALTIDGKARWFEVTTHALEDGEFHHFAHAIDTVIEAEIAQRNFVQTLTKTFAHLPIGLAVFDRNRQLVLFNPALVDLTSLPVGFLSGRPNLMSFFDHMRDKRIMPEPKNYQSWRVQLSDVVDAARDDRYCETWNLPSGLTYKITGRPHPDGAVAFLMEDISSEITLTRQFRSELELSQAVIETLEDPVAVFSQLGVLTFCNEAYRELWQTDPDSAFADTTIGDATQIWQQACQPSPIWGEIREFVTILTDRVQWESEVAHKTGARLLCRVEPLIAGATLVRFTEITARNATVPSDRVETV
ncbi:PAS-domain containing protein [Thalassococcus arenae]|uniref:PAS-domain containing protein n=1 Tax=Thalassococcus arenae TaxID=2851652 RepID=UPI0032AFD7E0